MSKHERESETINSEVEQFLVHPSREEEYCRRHNIELKRLQNGATIVAIPEESKFGVEASISFVFFGAGSYGTKPGVAHLTEHLIPQLVEEKAEHHDVEIRASTSQTDLKISCTGPANRKVQDFGIWPILPDLINVLKDPQEHIHDLAQAIEREKQTILNEIDDRDKNYQQRVASFLKTLINDPATLAVANNILGTEEQLEAITVDDVVSFIQERLISANLIIGVFSESDIQTACLLAQEIETLTKNFPRNGNKSKINWSFFERMRTDIQPGRIYKEKTGLENGIVTVSNTWPFKAHNLSQKYHSVVLLHHEFKNLLHRLSRDKTLGYETYSAISPGENIGLLTTGLDIPKRRVNDGLIFQTIKLTRALFSSVDIERILFRERGRQKTDVVHPLTRINRAASGLVKYRSMIDVDKILESYRQIGEDDLQEWIEFFQQTEPIITVVGDLP